MKELPPDHGTPLAPFEPSEKLVERFRADSGDSRMFITSSDDGMFRVYEEHWAPYGANYWIRQGPYHYTETLEQARQLVLPRLNA